MKKVNSQMDEKRVKIKYKPREQFRSLHSRKQRWSVLVCHRRAGKTVATLNDLIRGAVNECKPEGRYAFIFPQRNQAKDTAWRYLRRYAEPLLAKPPNESELRVDLVNGSMIRLYGADNPDALRGPYLDGVVLDEFADMKPEVWHEVVRPMLADRRGWATFIGTPKGKNEFFRLYESAKRDPAWFHMMLKASESALLRRLNWPICGARWERINTSRSLNVRSRLQSKALSTQKRCGRCWRKAAFVQSRSKLMCAFIPPGTWVSPIPRLSGSSNVWVASVAWLTITKAQVSASIITPRCCTTSASSTAGSMAIIIFLTTSQLGS